MWLSDAEDRAKEPFAVVENVQLGEQRGHRI
jgi:hypothetical protein